MLIFVSIVMTAIFSFSAGRIAYDPTINKPLKWESTSKLEQVYDVASLTAPLTMVNTEK